MPGCEGTNNKCSGAAGTQVGGTLPHNVGLSSSGQLSGTPDVAGTYAFTVQATQTGNPANFGTRQIVVVVTPLTMTTAGNLPYGNVNVGVGRRIGVDVSGPHGGVRVGRIWVGW